jgi:hypothetical protein
MEVCMSDNFADRQRRLLEDAQRAVGSAKEQRCSLDRAQGAEVWAGADATDRLRKVIEENQKATERQTRIMLWLTWVMAVLAVVTGVPAAVEIWRLASRLWPIVRSW